jgi:hypothetical protein
VRFLRVLLRKIRGKVLVIWDGAPIQRGQPIKDFLARGAATRRHREQGPGYAPELTPAEGIWNDRKRVELGNRCCPCPCPDLLALGLALRRGKSREVAGSRGKSREVAGSRGKSREVAGSRGKSREVAGRSAGATHGMSCKRALRSAATLFSLSHKPQ